MGELFCPDFIPIAHWIAIGKTTVIPILFKTVGIT